MPTLKLFELCPHAYNKQREREITSEKFSKLQIETDICRLDLGRTEVRLPQIPVQKADLIKQATWSGEDGFVQWRWKHRVN